MAEKEVKNTPDKDGLPELPEDLDFDSLLLNEGDAFGSSEPKSSSNEPQNSSDESQNNNESANQKPTGDIALKDNDKVRYQYWQSEAHKTKNELSRAMEMNQRLMEQVQQAAQKQQVQNSKGAEKKLTPPEEPVKPQYFNREEALTDSNSASARYLEAHDKWVSDTIAYNSKLTQMTTEENKKMFEEWKRESEEQKRKQAMVAEQRQRLSALAKQLKTQYNASDDQVQEFIQTMSKPDSLTLDNLWKLYAIENGVQINEEKSEQQQVSQPSEEFKQTQRAQSIPNSMGVTPGINNKNDGKSIEDLMIDRMKKMDPVEQAFT